MAGPRPEAPSSPRSWQAVDITPIPGRVGQKLRNELIFANTGGGDPAPTTYKLDIVIKESVTNELVEITGDATGRSTSSMPRSSWSIPPAARSCCKARRIARAPYDRFQEIFANVRARYDAENRAARSVADSLRTQVAAFLANAA